MEKNGKLTTAGYLQGKMIILVYQLEKDKTFYYLGWRNPKTDYKELYSSLILYKGARQPHASPTVMPIEEATESSSVPLSALPDLFCRVKDVIDTL